MAEIVQGFSRLCVLSALSYIIDIWLTDFCCLSLISMSVLCRIELILALLASGTFPVIRQIFKGYTVMLGWVVNISADRADILACSFIKHKIALIRPYRLRRIIQIHNPLSLKVFISQRCMR